MERRVIDRGGGPGVLLLTDPRMADHAVPGHPERPERLDAVSAGVVDAAAASGARLERPAVNPADAAQLERVHPSEYVAALDAAAADGGGWIDADTYLARDSMTAARLAAGAAVQAARAAADGSASVAFAAVRPPGHHASQRHAFGFCLLNNIAIAAMDLRASGLASRVAVLDWDVHHGNGTQAIFEADPAVAYASSHQMPLFPGTGDTAERGSGEGAGSIHNVPLHPGDGDEAFAAAWEERLLPAIEEHRPDAVLLSAGFDAHRADPLAHLEVTEAGYEQVARSIGALVRRLGGSGLAMVLEGGYEMAALRASSAATVRGALAGLDGR